MRALFAALCLCLAPAPAHAQTGAAPEIHNAAPSEAAIEAARDFMTLLIVESGAIDMALDRAQQDLLPVITSRMESSPLFAQLSSERREAVLSYFRVGYPEIMREMIGAQTPRLVENTSAQLATMFTEREMIDVAAFARTEPVRSALIREVLAGVEGKTDGPAGFSAEEEAAFDRFAQTESGRAFQQRFETALESIGPTILNTFYEIGPALQRRVADDVCAILGDDCPASLRAGAAPA